MMNSTDFSQLIKRHDRKPPLDISYQSLVTVETGIFSRSYFVVSRSHGDWSGVTGHVDVDLSDHSLQWQLKLRVSYHAVPSATERDVAGRIVKALGNPPTADAARRTFEIHVTNLVNAWVRERGGLLQLAQGRDSPWGGLVAKLRERMHYLSGLDVTARTFFPDIDAASERVKEIREDLSVEPANSKQPITVSLRIDLHADSGLFAHMNHARLDELQATVLALSRQHLQAKSLHQFMFGRQDIKQSLRALLIPVAADHGRKVEVALHYDAPVPEGVRAAATVKAELVFPRRADYPSDVTVQAIIDVELDDIAVYSAARMPNLDSCIEHACRTAIERHLINVSYVDLFLSTVSNVTGFARFDLKMNETKTAIVNAIAEIGYRVPGLEGVRLLPNFDFDELRRGFRISLTNEVFPMNVPSYDAAVDVDIRARIHKDDVIRQLFVRNVNIKTVIENDVREQIAGFLKVISPETYYTGFGGEDNGTAAGPAVERLRTNLIEYLKKQYQATEVEVYCRPRLTDLAELFLSLKREVYKLKLTAERIGLTFDVTCRVARIAKRFWQSFQHSRPTREAVEDLVGTDLRMWLSNNDGDTLRRTDDYSIRAAMNQGALDEVASTLGLDTIVVSVLRHATATEGGIKAIEDATAAKRRALQEQIRLLRNHAARLANAGEIEEVIASNKALETLEKQLEDMDRQSVTGPGQLGVLHPTPSPIGPIGPAALRNSATLSAQPAQIAEASGTTGELK
jgi:hypothetical protein